MRITFLILFVFLLSSCLCYPVDVVSSLEMAGDNRDELEKVLNEYRLKPRKYQAACYLIANMKYHKSNCYCIFDSEHRQFIQEVKSAYNLMRDSVNSTLSIDSLQNNIANLYIKQSIPKMEYFVSDVDVVTSDYLIDNIETAFSLYRNSKLLKDLSFNDFLKYILPYRCSDESICFKRSEILGFLYDIRLVSEEITSREIIAEYNSCVELFREVTANVNPGSHLGIIDLLMPKIKNDCQNIGAWTTNILRCVGLPTIYEYTPQWQNKTKRHFWCSSLEKNVFYPFTPPDNNLLDDWESNLQFAGKVYCKTFEANYSTPYFMKSESETIPMEFSSPLLVDQTFRYHQSITVSMPFEYNTSNKVAYLCFFDNEDSGLNAVGWGGIDITNKTVLYENVPLNVLFFPAIYEGDEYVPIGAPFIIRKYDTLDWLQLPHTIDYRNEYSAPTVYVKDYNKQLYDESGEIIDGLSFEQYLPQNEKINMTLYRKYPDKRSLRDYREQMVGTVLYGGHDLQGPYDTLFRITNPPEPYIQEYLFDNSRSYRYYLLQANDQRRLNVAYLELLGHFSNCHKCIIPSELPMLSHDADVPTNSMYNIIGKIIWTGNSVPNAFDSDNTSYVSASKILLDYEIPISIKGMRVLPRNADNTIVKGDSYSLLYYDFGWKEQSTLVAEANYINYYGVPSGCVYWLRNNSSGREELPFIYDNAQIFINTNE